MYRKVLIPLDGSPAAGEVLPLVRNEIAPDGEVILVQVISPAQTQRVGEHIILASQQEEADRAEAMAYLRSLARQQDWAADNWRLEVEVANSVADGIVRLADRESVDLIAMYTPRPEAAGPPRKAQHRQGSAAAVGHGGQGVWHPGTGRTDYGDGGPRRRPGQRHADIPAD